MLFLGKWMYLEPKQFLLTVFYNGSSLIIKILIAFKMNIYVYFLLVA
jgi:hypothetical protein